MHNRSVPQARTPPMGWNSWNAYSIEVDEEKIRNAADMLVETGMRDAGYEYLVVDDTWMAETLAPAGSFEPNPESFPNGIEPLAEYVHDQGLQFGIYSSAGTVTCAGYPASLGKERRHAEQFAEWGVDYLKYDNCGAHDGRDALDRYSAMGEALAEVDREIVYALCEWGDNEPWNWGRNAGGQLWRTTGDILPKWEATEDDEYGLGVVEIIDEMARPEIARANGPDGWNDPDMLHVGNGPDSGQGNLDDLAIDEEFPLVEQRTHFSFWCCWSAPLMAGNDLREMDDDTAEILLNEDAIAIDQDPLGVQGTRDRVYGDREVWSKRLADRGAAVILFNRGESETEVETHVDEIDLGAEADEYRVLDVWSDETWTTSDEIHATVEPHGVAFYRVGPA